MAPGAAPVTPPTVPPGSSMSTPGSSGFLQPPRPSPADAAPSNDQSNN